MNIYYIIGAVFVLQFIFLAIYAISKKKKNAKKQAETFHRLESVYNNPNIVKVALWINIDSVNGEPLDESYVYKTNMKNGLLNPNKVEVALFNPGIYTFVVSSNSREEYRDVRMQVELHAGMTYQLGCNEEGTYLVNDPNPARYELKPTL